MNERGAGRDDTVEQRSEILYFSFLPLVGITADIAPRFPLRIVPSSARCRSFSGGESSSIAYQGRGAAEVSVPARMAKLTGHGARWSHLGGLVHRGSCLVPSFFFSITKQVKPGAADNYTDPW